MEAIVEIKKLLTSDKFVIGTKEIMKGLREKTIKKVFLSSNCPEEVVKDVEKYATLTSAEVVTLNIPNEEFGAICKKPFFVSVAGVTK